MKFKKILVAYYYTKFSCSSEVTNASENADSDNKKCAFQILMSSQACTFLPEKMKLGTDNLSNLKSDILTWLSKNKLGWSKQYAESLGKDFVNDLSSALWYLDGKHTTLKDRSLAVPDTFAQFQGYNKPESYKKKKIDPLDFSVNEISRVTSSLLNQTSKSYMKSLQWRGVCEAMLRLATNLEKYSTYLQKQSAEAKQNREMLAVQEEAWDWKVKSPTHVLTPGQKARYRSLHRQLHAIDNYEAVFINEHLPTDRRRRFEYLQRLVVPYKVKNE